MIYTKNDASGNPIFGDCRVIELDGCCISNPTAEMIAAAGWVEYVPPVIPPQPQSYPTEMQIVAAVRRMLSTSVEQLSDEDALSVAVLFPFWADRLNKENPQQEGKPIAADERLWDDGKLWKCIIPHNALANWRPADSPSLFVEVSIEEWPPIPEHIPSTDPWNKGRKGTWKGQHYICQLDGCVWNPDEYAAAWELVPES